MSTFSGPNVVRNGLLLYLDAANKRSYPGSGSTWYDLSGHNKHATLFNSPTFFNSYGGEIFFNGSSQYASCPSGFADFTAGITILAIVDPDTINNNERIIDFSNGAPSDSLVMAMETPDKISNYFTQGTTYNGGIGGVSGAVADSPNIFTAISNGTNNFMYRNGTLIGQDTNSNLPLNVTRTINYIGRSPFGGDPYYTGAMYALLIYNRGLSQSEVQQNFHAFRGRFGF